MKKPLVAIVGRPNVGKSTFFNRIAGKQISIVEDIAGVTRDRIYIDSEWNGCAFTMIDTGGIEMGKDDRMLNYIRSQAIIAVDTADVILFFVDGRAGVVNGDFEVAKFLRKSGKPIILVVNKIDNYSASTVYDFYELGLGEPYPISSTHGTGTGDVLDKMVELFNQQVPAGEKEEDDIIRIAVVGKPNAGKSSLVNKLLGYERSIVSDIAGTTRDAIDTDLEFNGKKYKLVDTAGIRRKKSIESHSLEYFSVVRAFGAMRQADVCLVMVDSAEGLTEQDVRICGFAHEEGIPSIIVMNKWDLIEKDTNTINEFEKKLKEDLKFMDYFKSIYISAKTGQRVDKIFSMVDYVYAQSHFRVQTGVLNDVIIHAVATSEPPSHNGRRLKIIFSTQVGVCPPKFVIKVNDVQLVHFSYKRYLENVIRKAFSLDGTPIKLIFRNRNEKED